MSLRLDKHVKYDNTLTLLQKVLISERIATHEAGSDIYPSSEACYGCIEYWERDTGRNFFREFSSLYQAGHGSQ